MSWSREDKATSVTAKKNLFIANENTIEDNNGVRIEIQPYP